MIYSKEVENMCTVKCGASHGCAPIPEEGKWVYSREIKDISGLTHGIGWCCLLYTSQKLRFDPSEEFIINLTVKSFLIAV